MSAGQRFIEHHAEAVPVAGHFGATVRLFGGHVGGSPRHALLGKAMLIEHDLGDQAEIEDLDVPLRRNQRRWKA